MSKQTALKIVNPLLVVLLLNQATTGLLHEKLPRETFELLHSGGWLLVLVSILHLALNWNWVKAAFLRRGSRTAR